MNHLSTQTEHQLGERLIWSTTYYEMHNTHLPNYYSRPILHSCLLKMRPQPIKSYTYAAALLFNGTEQKL